MRACLFFLLLGSIMGCQSDSQPEERLFHWPQGRRPDDHPGLSDLGL